MSQDKRQFTASVQPGTVDTLDDYAERENLNRSQAVTQVTEEWAELTDEGRVPIELIQAEPEQAVPGDNTAAADSVEAARENADTLVDIAGKSMTVGGALMLQWWVFEVPELLSGALLGVGVVFALLGVLNLTAGVAGVLDGTATLVKTELFGGEQDDTDGAQTAEGTTDGVNKSTGAGGDGR